MKHGTGIATLAAAAALLAACASLPEQVESLEQARADIRMLEQDELANEAASTELESARAALQRADDAYEAGAPLAQIEHQAYIAQRHADISRQRIAAARAGEQIDDAELERNRILLEAREREAEELARQSQAAAERNAALRERAVSAEMQAQDAIERSADLENELQDLQAEETDRGLVLTLGDVLFDTGEATLKAGAERTIDRLAGFLRDYPERNVRIEGHTDSRGGEEFNLDLSERRAESVRNALIERGITGERAETVGLGEAYPVASNSSTVGMQQNRRVEIVISDEQGLFRSGSQRTAAVRRN